MAARLELRKPSRKPDSRPAKPATRPLPSMDDRRAEKALRGAARKHKR